MKKIVSILIGLIMMVASLGLLPACVSKPGAEGYKLSVGYDLGGYGIEWLENSLKAFAAKEGLDFEKDIYIDAEKGYMETVVNKLQNNIQVRDIILGSGTGFMDWVSQGWVEPIDEVFTATLSNGSTVKDMLKNPDMIETAKYKGSYYQLTSANGAWGIYYNKTMFEQKGWAVPTTYAELIALCETIYNDYVKNKPEADKIYPFGCSSDIFNYWEFLVQNWIGQLLGPDGYLEFAKQEGPEYYAYDSVYSQAKLKALKAFEGIVQPHDGGYVKSQSSGFMALQMLFCQGKIAMMPNGNWFENEMAASLPAGMEIALMPTPAIEGAKVVNVNYAGEVGGWFIPSAAQNKDLAKKFMIFMAEEQQCKNMLKDSGMFPGYNYDYSDIYNDLTPCQKSVYNVMNTAQSFAFVSTSVVSKAGLGFWAKGQPYDSMLSGSRMSAEAVIQAEDNYLNGENGEWHWYVENGNL